MRKTHLSLFIFMIITMFFAALSIFVIVKLFKVLGSTDFDNDLTEDAKKKYDEIKKTIMAETTTVSENTNIMNSQNEIDEENFSEAEKESISVIKSHDSNFSINKFLQGAKTAFEIILEAYNSDDKATLGNLLTEQQNNVFCNAIDRRVNNGQIMNLTLISIKDSIISEIRNDDTFAFITVKFESEQISYISDKISGELISGSKTKVKSVVEYWTFMKKIKSSSKIWELNDIRNQH